MPRGIKWDYSVYCFESNCPGNAQSWTTYVGRQKSGTLWIGRSSWEASGSYSCPTPGDFIDDLPDSTHKDFLNYFSRNAKYRDVAEMMRWRSRDIRIIPGNLNVNGGGQNCG
mgnify:CR=1 FL=1